MEIPNAVKRSTLDDVATAAVFYADTKERKERNAQYALLFWSIAGRLRGYRFCTQASSIEELAQKMLHLGECNVRANYLGVSDQKEYVTAYLRGYMESITDIWKRIEK